MIITVSQKLEKSINHYSFYDEQNTLLFTSNVKMPFLPKPRNFDLLDKKGEIVSSMEQTDLLDFLIEWMPIVNLFTKKTCKYYYLNKGVKCGYFLDRGNSLEGNICGDIYEAKLHSGNFVSLYKNQSSIGLVNRQEGWRENNTTFYRINYDGLCDVKILIFLFILSDIIWFTENGCYHYDSIYVIGDKGFDSKLLESGETNKLMGSSTMVYPGQSFTGYMTGILFSILLLSSFVLMLGFFTMPYSQIRLGLLGLSSDNADVLYVLNYNYRQWAGTFLVWVAIILLISARVECFIIGAKPNLKKLKSVCALIALIGVVIIIPYFGDYYKVTGDSITHVNGILRTYKTYTLNDITGIEKICSMRNSKSKNPAYLNLEYNISLNDGRSFNLFKSNQHAGIASDNKFIELKDLVARVSNLDEHIRQAHIPFKRYVTEAGYSVMRKNYSPNAFKLLVNIYKQ